MTNITDILAGARGLAGIQELLCAAAVEQMLRSMMEDPDALLACHLRRAKFKPQRKLTAYYDLQLRRPWGTGSNIRPVVVTWTPEHPAQSAPVAGALQTEIMQRGLATPFRTLTSTTPASTMQIQVAPLDPHYPQLARLSDPAHVRDLLASCLASGKRTYAVTALRYRPRQRHVLRYDTARDGSVPAGLETIFAKLYPEGSHPSFLTATNQIADWLAAAAPHTAVLRPLAHVPRDGVILYAQVEGRPLSESLGGTDCRVTHHLQQTGAALRALHGAPANLAQNLPTLDLAGELKAIARTCEHIQVLLPAVGQTISALLAEAGARYAQLPKEAPTVIHGDFKADHVLVADEQRTLIDFDSCALADPAFDIGKFLADLDWWYADAQQSSLRQARQAFLSGYGLEPTHPRLLRVRVWEALIRIKITSHRIRLFDDRWAERTAAAIARVQRDCI